MNRNEESSYLCSKPISPELKFVLHFLIYSITFYLMLQQSVIYMLCDRNASKLLFFFLCNLAFQCGKLATHNSLLIRDQNDLVFLAYSLGIAPRTFNK